MKLALFALALQLAYGADFTSFSLHTLDGAPVASSTVRGSKATVVTFIAARCPVSNAYNQRMAALHRDFAARGVAFLLVDSNANESSAELKTYARQARFDFPLYRDPSNVVADLFGAQTTPETFLLDSDGVLRYHGAIDDAQTPARVKVSGLRLAIENILAGKPVDPDRIRAFGCTLHRVRT